MPDDAPRTLSYQRARFAAQLPLDHLYTPAHFWLGPQPNQTWHVGLTKFGSRMLGEIVDFGFETAPGSAVRPDEVLGWLEGFKGIVDLLALADGLFLGSNPALENNSTLVNQDPHGAGWLFAISGTPAPACLTIENYARLLDQTIDRLLLTSPSPKEPD